jgi:MYXO-CTERM domain-containing protein
MIASHELAESVTDTEIGLAQGLDAPIAWYDAVDQLAQGSGGGEIGDLCDAVAGIAAGYTVQKLWSNLNNQCIDAAPLCNGTTQPPYCTPCAATDDGIGCLGATPVCETSATSTRVGQCVACTATSACPNGPASYCDTTADTCRGCQPSDCTGATAVCETAGAEVGQCVQCDPASSSACTGTTALCNPATFTCVGCVTNATCSGSTPICDADANECRACESSGDCNGKVCETETGNAKVGQCVPCSKDADCAGNAAGNACKAGTCVAGAVDAGQSGGADAGKKPGGKDASVGATDAGAKDDGGATGSGSSGGCTVGGGSEGALAWLAALGVAVLGRRKRR